MLRLTLEIDTDAAGDQHVVRAYAGTTLLAIVQGETMAEAADGLWGRVFARLTNPRQRGLVETLVGRGALARTGGFDLDDETAPPAVVGAPAASGERRRRGRPPRTPGAPPAPAPAASANGAAAAPPVDLDELIGDREPKPLNDAAAPDDDAADDDYAPEGPPADGADPLGDFG